MKLCLNCERTFEGENWQCPFCEHAPLHERGFLCFAPQLASNAEGFDASYFQKLASFESGYFWFEARNRLILWALQSFFPNARSFLEVGCGTGFVLRALHEAIPTLNLTGSEIFIEGLEFAQQRLPNVILLQMDAGAIPFREEFDVIGAFDVLEHIPDDRGAIDQMVRALKPGGRLIFTVPQHTFLWSKFDTFSHHQRRYSRSSMITQLKSMNLRVQFVSSFVTFLLPVLLLSRMRDGLQNRAYDPWQQFQLGAKQNAFLGRIMGAEQSVIQRRWSLPIGGSLLVVAIKDS